MLRPLLLLFCTLGFFLCVSAFASPTIPPSATLATDGDVSDNNAIDVNKGMGISCILETISGHMSPSGGKLSATVTMSCFSPQINETAIMHVELQVGYPRDGLIIFAGGGQDRANCLQTGFQTYELCDFLYNKLSGLYNYSTFTDGSCTVVMVDGWFGGTRDFYLLSSQCTKAPSPVKKTG